MDLCWDAEFTKLADEATRIRDHHLRQKYAVTITIRPYRNTDTNSVCEVWNAHHQEVGPAMPMDVLQCELLALAKPFCDPNRFLVAEQDGRLLGWLLWSCLPDENLTDESDGRAGIAALCVRPLAEADQVASELLRVCLADVRKAGFSDLCCKPALPHSALLLCFGPLDSAAGVPPQDQRLQQWLQQAGFVAADPTSHWELDLLPFQAPMDRAQMQIRRSTQVSRQVDEPLLPWFQACVLGHLEPTSFQLTHRIEKRVVQEVLYWGIAPELQTVPETVMWLWPPAETEEESALAELQFLIADSLRELQHERIDSIRTVTGAGHVGVNNLLRKLGFQALDSGIVFRIEV